MPDGSVKLGFRTHYPQIETKLTVRGADMDDIERKLAPVQAEVRKRLGNFILAEDDQTLEGVVLAALAERDGSLAVVETFTGGQIAARIAHLPGAEKVFRRGLVARDPAEIAAALGLDGGLISGELSREAAEAVARAAREETGATHALAVLIEVDDGPDRIDFGGSIHLAIAAGGQASNPAARASMAAATGCASAPSSSASTACAATCRACPSPSAPISSALTAADRAPASAMNSARRPSEAERAVPPIGGLRYRRLAASGSRRPDLPLRSHHNSARG